MVGRERFVNFPGSERISKPGLLIRLRILRLYF